MSLFPSFSLETMMQAQDNMPCSGMLATAAAKPSAALTTCTKAGYAALAGIPRDAFAWSAFPSLPTSAGGAGIPSWYLTLPLGAASAADRLSQVVANTGVLATDLALNFANTSNYAPPLQCTDFVTSDNDVAAAWFAQIMAVSNSAQYRAFVVNFKTARDTLFSQSMACPCTAPLPVLQPYCDVLIAYRGACKAAGILPAACEIGIKIYGTMGVCVDHTRRQVSSAVKSTLYRLSRALALNRTGATSLETRATPSTVRCRQSATRRRVRVVDLIHFGAQK